MKKQNDIEKLRDLLFRDEQDAIEELKQRLSNRYQRTQDVSDVLADALRLTYKRDGEDLSEALGDLLGQAVHQSVQQDPQRFADALYPSILPAIRRSVREMSRQFIERIDQLLTQSFSLRHLKWRFESWRTGVPLADIVLRESIDYQVDQLLLIQNGSGLLLAHVYSEDASQTDSDAVSGMLWAIGSFIKDSFTGEDGELDRVTAGEHIIYLTHGPSATLASVIQGVAPPDYFDKARDLLGELHRHELAELKGNPVRESSRRRLEALLSPLLRKQKKAAGPSDRARRIRLAAAGAVVAGLLAVWGYHLWEAHEVRMFFKSLNEQPGVMISTVDRVGGKWKVRGLIDPVMGDNETILQQSGLAPDEVDIRLKPFLSLEPEVVMTRLGEQLNIPAGVGASIDHGVLKLSGAAPVQWYVALRKNTMLPSGVKAIDTADLTLDANDALSWLESTIGVPGSVEIQANNGDLLLSGSATRAWFRELERVIQLLGDKIGFSIDGLEKE